MNPKEKARAVYDRMMKKDHFSQWMGISLVVVDEGYCKISMKVQHDMLNGFGILHGGVAYAFADSAFAFASNSYGRLSVSIHGAMNFAKSAEEGEILYAESQLLNLSYKTAEFDVNVMNDDGDIYYRFRGTVYRTSKEV